MFTMTSPFRVRVCILLATLCGTGIAGCATAQGDASDAIAQDIATDPAPSVTCALPTMGRRYGASSVVPERTDSQPGIRIGTKWFFLTQGFLYYPVEVNTGETIDEYHVYVNKGSNSGSAGFTVFADLVEVDSTTGAQSTVATSTNAATAPGNIRVGLACVGRTASPGKTYLVRIADRPTAGGGGAPSPLDSFTDAELLMH